MHSTLMAPGESLSAPAVSGWWQLLLMFLEEGNR